MRSATFLCCLICAGSLFAAGDNPIPIYGSANANNYREGVYPIPYPFGTGNVVIGVLDQIGLQSITSSYPFLSQIVFDEEGNLYSAEGNILTPAPGPYYLVSYTKKLKLRWKSAPYADAPGAGSPVVGHDLVYCPWNDTASPGVRGISKQTGSTVWNAILPVRVNMTPCLYDGFVYGITRPANIGSGYAVYAFKINASNGFIVYTNAITVVSGETPDTSMNTTLIPDKFGADAHGLYFSIRNVNADKVFGIRTDTGAKAWDAGNAQSFRSSIMYDQATDLLIWPHYDDVGGNFCHAFDPVDGTIRWVLNDAQYTPPAVHKGGYTAPHTLYPGGGSFIYANSGGAVERFSYTQMTPAAPQTWYYQGPVGYGEFCHRSFLVNDTNLGVRMFISGARQETGAPDYARLVFLDADTGSNVAEWIPPTGYDVREPFRGLSIGPDGTIYFYDGKGTYGILYRVGAPQLSLTPLVLDFGQTSNDLPVQIGSLLQTPVANCTAATNQPWLSIAPATFSAPTGTPQTVIVTVDRTKFVGPAFGAITITAPGLQEPMSITVYADTPRPVPVVTPPLLNILVQGTKQFSIRNDGTAAMYFTNTSADAFVSVLTPPSGVVAPGATQAVSYLISGAPYGATGTVQIAYNAYNGAVLTHKFIIGAALYYVATTGSNTNDGRSIGTPWQTISHALNNTPNGNEYEGHVTINVAAGTYLNESSDNSGYWFMNMSSRQYVMLAGAGPLATLIAKGTSVWHTTINNDVTAERPVLRLFGADHVRVTGLGFLGNEPTAYTTGEGYPEMSAVVDINGSSGIRLDHLYLQGLYTGLVYSAAVSNWVSEWNGWWFHAINVNGVIGPSGVLLDHLLTRGFIRAVYNNNYGSGGVDSNTNLVTLDYCTFVEGVCVSDAVQAVNWRVSETEYGPSLIVQNSIISEWPWLQFPAASEGVGLNAQALFSVNNPLYSVFAFSNQMYATGVPVPGEAWWNDNVLADNGERILNFTNEPPAFETVGGLPYSTQLETAFGTRDVGWNVVPEPLSALLATLLLAGIAAKRM
ncbi:MAG: hypothetical protein NTV22_12460 [bacterium]|nr:hypothetical protein [bacterium]